VAITKMNCMTYMLHINNIIYYNIMYYLFRFVLICIMIYIMYIF